MNLNKLGFTPFFSEQVETVNNKYKQTIPARVVLEHKLSYRVISEAGEWLATVAGNFAYNALAREDYPAVGDWVLVEQMPGEEKAIIHKLLQRKSVFSRKVAGLEIEEQIVAANVDIVLLVMSLNADFNIRRLERYLIAAWDSGAKPLIVLTKADLCDDVEGHVSEVEAIAFGVDIVVTSAVTGEGFNTIRTLFTEGVTGALLGSSGAGKSTIMNALLETEHMKVSGIREDDAKGRHTTTHRELVMLQTGGCLIDTPGMRELQLWNQSDSLAVSFQDIEELADQCRYRDCTHKSEPHCAIRLAITEDVLDEARLQSYFKLQRELAYIERKTNAQAKLVEQRKWKKITKGMKANKKTK
ncbi:ribosome small subunit-dependent GTPase A [Solibacillus sp. CAU 1738]|uniref:ribosome small subunit-dependent GTPase A n=1 Tax=Solibacillus sp. CAU 1738 TaxID=3140363 RepID=UPI0032601D82